MKSYPSTLPNVTEKHEIVVKDGVSTIDVVVVDCIALFKQTMEVVKILQEDPTLQVLNTEFRELQQQYDEVREMTRTIATAQRLTKLQEAKQLLTQVEAVQKKEAVLKARLGPWLDEAYIVFVNIKEKSANLQSMQQKIKQDSAGPAIEQLVEQIKQAATQSMAEVAVAQVL